MKGLKDIDEAVLEIKIRRAKLNLKDSLNYAKTTIEYIKENKLDENKDFQQLYLNYLDELNKLSVTD